VSCGLLRLNIKIAKWINIVNGLWTEAETSVNDSRKGELTANQDDERCWITINNIWLWMSNKVSRLEIGVSLRSLDLL
jgi:hypothetical protein